MGAVTITIVEIVIEGVKIYLYVDQDGFEAIKKRKALSLTLLNQHEDYGEIKEIKGKTFLDFKKVSLIRIESVY